MREHVPRPRDIGRDLRPERVDGGEAPLVAQAGEEGDPDRLAVQIAAVEVEEVRLDHDARVGLDGRLHADVADAAVHGAPARAPAPPTVARTT